MAKSVRQLRKIVSNQFDEKANKPLYLSATLGHPDGTLWVEARKGYVWARVGGDNGKIIQVWVGGKFLPRYNLPVKVWRPPYNPAEYEIVGIQTSALQTDGTGDNQDILIEPNTVGPHALQHGLYGGDTDWIQSQRLVPLLAWPTAPPSWYLYVNSGWYPHADSAKYFAGGNTASLATHVPSAGYRWVIVYLDGVTNALAYVDSPEYGSFDSTTVQTLLDLLPTDSIPLCAVVLRATSTVITNTQSLQMVYDLRLFVGAILGDSILSTFGPKTVNTVFAGPATGTPATPTFRALALSDLPSNILTADYSDPDVSLWLTDTAIATDRYQLSPSYIDTSLTTLTKTGMVTDTFCSFEIPVSDMRSEVLVDGLFKAIVWSSVGWPAGQPASDGYTHVLQMVTLQIELIQRNLSSVETVIATALQPTAYPIHGVSERYTFVARLAATKLAATDTLVVRVLATVTTYTDYGTVVYHDPTLMLQLAGDTFARVEIPLCDGLSGISRSGSTTDGHLAVWNGTDVDSLKDGGVPGTGGVGAAPAVAASALLYAYLNLK